MPPFRRFLPALVLCVLTAAPAFSQTVRLKDGRMLTGKVTAISGVAENPSSPAAPAGEVVTQPILMIDDELRRVYVSKRLAAEVVEMAPESLVKITPWQNPSHSAATLVSVGPALGISPWDEFGRRIYEMQFEGGRLSVVQGITELTPRYAKVEALLGPERVVTWDSRISTTSIPSDALAKILAKAVPQDDPQARLQIVRFYNQAGRYQEARKELERIVEQFPALKDLKAEVGGLRRMAAQSLQKELQLRRSAGQHQLVQTLLSTFPVDQVDGQTLVDVRKMISDYEQEDARFKQIAEALRANVAAISDPDQRGLASPVIEEIIRELTHNNVDRLSSFVQLRDDNTLSASEKVSLAISGWILGAEEANQNLLISMSVVKVRELVVRYLREPLAAERQKLLDLAVVEEGASIDRLAKLVARMKPPWNDPKQAADEDGFLELSAPGQTDDGDFRYLVQLPPEYDPYRKYPTLVVLCGAYNTPEQEMDFWAGSSPGQDDKGKPLARRGHAMRYGYITIAVDWQKPHQYEYEFSAREHVAALTALRDATRRFSIDADRVFVTGHDMGGELAWDLAQSHPDLWAGVMPFNALADKYLVHYWENSRYVPLYFIAGELDGRKIAENASVWNKYLKTPPTDPRPGEGRPGFDATVVEYQGRGHEPFHDEILHLFDWMGRKARSTMPKEFECDTLRTWDNFFWWMECDAFPPQFMMHPTEWSDRRPKPASVAAKIQAENHLLAKTTAQHTTIWLSPEMVDFSKPIRIAFNGGKIATPPEGVKPDPRVLLEDVRTRGDRQRPFWAKLESP